MAEHRATLNTLSALLQVTIGLGLMPPWTRRAALAASIAWGLMVWWLRAGLATLFAGPVSELAGLPGAALICGVIAVLLCPPSRAAALCVDRAACRATRLGGGCGCGPAEVE